MSRRASAAVRAALRDHEPSEEQWAAIEHAPEPVAIIAGAGSGKTAVMAARVVWMTEEALVSPAQILGLTFTNKAAAELESRINDAFGEFDPRPSESPVIATYNAFADALLREHGVRIGIDPEVGLLSEAQRWQLLLSCFDTLPPFDAVDSRSPASICRSVLGLADAAANHLVTPEAIIEEDQRVLADALQFPDEAVVCSRRRIELARVVRAYLDAKVASRRIDFGDQVTRAVEILERHPVVATDLRNRFPAVLLDEYQDTNVAQRRLIQLLAPTGSNVTAVGDARQNIFQWRGSTLFNLIDFPTRHFLRIATGGGGEAHDYLTLSENYRSGRKILAVANRLIERVPPGRRPGRELHAHPANGEGWVGVKLTADQDAEAAFIAREIERLHSGGEPGAWSECAILVRRKAHIRPIHDALRERGIPVDVVGLAGLLEVPEVLDAIAWLRVVNDPGPASNRWLARLLLGPRLRIHYRDVALLARWAAKQTRDLTEQARVQAEEGEPAPDRGIEPEPDEVAYSLWEALDHVEEIDRLGPEALRRLRRVRGEIATLRQRLGEPLPELVQAVVRETGIAEALETRGPAGLVNITGFLSAVAAFAPVTGEPSLPAFLAYLDAAEEVEETLDMASPSDIDSVKLMTVHQAKGLEFDVVFVPGVAARTNDKGDRVDSIFPDERVSNPMTSHGQLPHSVREDAAHLPSPWLPDGRPRKKAELLAELRERAVEDERRLFYVAVTRARHRLYVTAAWWYQRHGKPRGPSQFFDEVASDPETVTLEADAMPAENPLLARLGALAVWPPDPPHRLRPDSWFAGWSAPGDGAGAGAGAGAGDAPASYPAALDALVARTLSAEGVLGRLDPAARLRAEELLREHRAVADALVADPGDGAHAPRTLPKSVSATQVAGMLAAPPGWAPDRAPGGGARPEDAGAPAPPPLRTSAAARVGVEVHRWIEEQARGLTGLADEESLDAPSLPLEPARVGELRETFTAMGFPSRRLARLDSGEPMAELPFLLKVGGRVVKGRIDAVYETEDGGLEVVDFKTGQRVAGAEVDQLAIYAAALRELGVAGPGPLTVTYCYLADGTTESRTLTAEQGAEALAAVAARLADAPG
ncbi:MAG TPA: UvrD-helicase domain-containing protein [Actinomycetota bacterium]|nr:UvrD-helicase domain-containing protein [Actinomycetota bacterium]